jgi:hypothetical protein
MKELNFNTDNFSAFEIYNSLDNYHLDNFDDTYYFDFDLITSDNDQLDIIAFTNSFEGF